MKEKLTGLLMSVCFMLTAQTGGFDVEIGTGERTELPSGWEEGTVSGSDTEEEDISQNGEYWGDESASGSERDSAVSGAWSGGDSRNGNTSWPGNIPEGGDTLWSEDALQNGVTSWSGNVSEGWNTSQSGSALWTGNASGSGAASQSIDMPQGAGGNSGDSSGGNTGDSGETSAYTGESQRMVYGEKIPEDSAAERAAGQNSEEDTGLSGISSAVEKPLSPVPAAQSPEADENTISERNKEAPELLYWYGETGPASRLYLEFKNGTVPRILSLRVNGIETGWRRQGGRLIISGCSRENINQVEMAVFMDYPWTEQENRVILSGK